MVYHHYTYCYYCHRYQSLPLHWNTEGIFKPLIISPGTPSCEFFCRISASTQQNRSLVAHVPRQLSCLFSFPPINLNNRLSSTWVASLVCHWSLIRIPQSDAYHLASSVSSADLFFSFFFISVLRMCHNCCRVGSMPRFFKYFPLQAGCSRNVGEESSANGSLSKERFACVACCLIYSVRDVYQPLMP